MKQLLLISSLLILPFLFAMDTEPEKLEKLKNLVDQKVPEIEQLYKHLHANPELSLHEKESGKTMAKHTRDLGFEVTENVGGYGVVAMMKNGEGPTVLIRTDTDALPINEQTPVEWASKVTAKTDDGLESGVMHACGHDMHMAVWAGTAKTLVEMKDSWSGTLMMIAQPAEEIGAGAKAMLEDGLYERFGVPDYGIALHCNAKMETGTIGYCPGYALASVDMVSIKIFGEGGHGAYPHTTVDPVVLGSTIIMDLQTIMSRNVTPTDAGVVTVGAIHGGTRGNIIPDQVELQLTLRSYKKEVRDKMLKRIKEICDGNAMAFGLPPEKYPEVDFTFNSTPATYNDPALVEKALPAFIEALGKDNVIQTPPVMGGEDFSHFHNTKEKVPTFMFGLGTINPERLKKMEAEGQVPGLHSPFYYPDPTETIRTGITAMTAGVMEIMKK
ncbi:MAG: amidohydrolase [Bacteroidota bacterium]